jgi:DNA-binding PucR family transcriptional regulator
MAHRRSLAEVELRLRRELVEDVLSGQADDGAYARAAAIGHDLHRSHYVVAIGWQQPAGRAEVSDAVAAAAKDLDLNPLQVWRTGTAVLLVPGRVPGEELYQAVSQEIGPAGAIGVGGRCTDLDDFPRSLQQSLKALEIRRTSQQPYGVTGFDQLGLYRILGTGRGSEDVTEFVHQWIGQLIDYDRRRHTSLVETLSQYFECGGNYDHAAQVLLIHRSTLRYRLRRIREVTGLDLADVDCRLNLHVATRAWRVLDGMV